MRQFILIVCFLGIYHQSFAQPFHPSYSTYTPDGLFDTSARPIRFITPNSNGETRIGYLDYGSGQYVPRVGFWQNSSYMTAANNSIGNIGDGSLTINVGANNEERFRITPTGNVGIGTTTPLSKLQVDGGNVLVRNLPNVDNTSAIMIAHSINYSNHTTFGTSLRTITQSAGSNTYGLQLFTQESYSTGQTEKVRIQGNGNVGIGTTTPTDKLSVNGNIRAKEIKVETLNWPDYVFEPEHKLPTLPEIEQFIKTNKHLPEIPSAAEVEKDGVKLGEMNTKLLQKIEELTLYLIEQNKRIEKLESLNK